MSLCRAVTFAVASVCFGAAPIGAAPLPQDSAAAAKQLEALWADLEKGDVDASRALLKLADRPKEAVVFLRDRMFPLKVSAERVRELLADLGQEDEKVWKKAFEELEYFDPRLAIDLETLMDVVKDAPARPRMVAVLSGRPAAGFDGKTVTLRKIGNGDGFNFFDGRGSWWAEHRVDRLGTSGWSTNKKKWTRASRAVVLLEHVGTPAALDVLTLMGTGHPDAAPTKEAKAAVERLTAKPR